MPPIISAVQMFAMEIMVAVFHPNSFPSVVIVETQGI